MGSQSSSPPASALPAICHQDLSFLPKQRGGILFKKQRAHAQTENTLAWNINLPRKRHRESETSSNLMQEKTAIWLGRVNLERGEGEDLLFLSLSHPQ